MHPRRSLFGPSSFAIRHCLLSLLLAPCTLLPAAPPPELTVLRTQYEKVLAERVTAPFDAEKGALDTKFIAALERAATDVKKTGNLEAVLAITADKKRLADKLPLPEDDDQTPDALKKLRTIYREQLQKLQDQRTANHRAILPVYTAKLQVLETTLTKGDRIDEAKEVKDYRAGLSLGVTPAAVSTTSDTKSAPARKFPPPDNRAALQWVLQMSGRAWIKADGAGMEIKKPEDIPAGEFVITAINLTNPSKAKVKYKNLEPIAGLPELDTLTLHEFPLHDADTDVLASFPKLTRFENPNTHGDFTGAQLAKLAPDLPLKVLHLSGLPISGKATQAIGRWTLLDILGLRGAKLDDDDLRHLTGLAALKVLNLGATEVTADGLLLLKGAQGINRMGWSPKPKQGARDFPLLAAAFPNIKIFDLVVRGKVTEEDIAAMAVFPILDFVEINGGELSRGVFAGLARIPGLKGLRLYWCPQLLDEAVLPLAASQSLENLEIDACPLNAKTLEALGGIPSLKSLAYTRTKAKAEEIAAFAARHPNLKVRDK